MSRRFWNFYLIVMSLLALLLGAQLSHAQQTARIVHYHANDIVAIRAKMHYTTLIKLPPSEKILEVATGDKDFWILDAPYKITASSIRQRRASTRTST